MRGDALNAPVLRRYTYWMVKAVYTIYRRKVKRLLKRNTVRWYLKAGCRASACAYALASIALAWLRMLLAGNQSIRGKHQKFLRDLSKSYRSMLFGSGMSHSLDSEAIITNTGLN